MSWARTAILLAVIALLGWAADRWAGPVGTRISDRQAEPERVRIIAVATAGAEVEGLIDFLDALQQTHADVPQLEVDIVRGRVGANFRSMDATAPAVWSGRVLLSYRRDQNSETTIVSPTVPGAFSR